MNKIGYRLINTNYYKNLVNINTINNLDFHYVVKNKINQDQKIFYFDIGANVGQSAKKIIQYFPNATLYCFEPVEKTYKLLAENMRGYQNVNTYKLALGNFKGEMEISLRENSEWNSLDKTLNEIFKSSVAALEIIEVDTVDNFVKDNNISKIDILKSDTEGYEIEVLKGAKYCLENNLIDILYIEVGFNKQDLQHTHLNEVIEELENYDYGFSGLFEKSYTEKTILHFANALFIKR